MNGLVVKCQWINGQVCKALWSRSRTALKALLRALFQKDAWHDNRFNGILPCFTCHAISLCFHRHITRLYMPYHSGLHRHITWACIAISLGFTCHITRGWLPVVDVVQCRISFENEPCFVRALVHKRSPLCTNDLTSRKASLGCLPY